MAKNWFKFCGLRRKCELQLAAELGAGAVGLVHYEKSPRHVSLSHAALLTKALPSRNRSPSIWCLLVNPSLSIIRSVMEEVKPDGIQLHGSENHDLIAELAARWPELVIIKAIGVARVEDLNRFDEYQQVCHQIILDAKPNAGGPLPGGNGCAFDWSVPKRAGINAPYILSGGLTANNVAIAAETSGVRAFDVSSGIEMERGVKSHEKMRAFARAVLSIS